MLESSQPRNARSEQPTLLVHTVRLFRSRFYFHVIMYAEKEENEGREDLSLRYAFERIIAARSRRGWDVIR